MLTAYVILTQKHLKVFQDYSEQTNTWPKVIYIFEQYPEVNEIFGNCLVKIIPKPPIFFGLNYIPVIIYFHWIKILKTLKELRNYKVIVHSSKDYFCQQILRFSKSEIVYLDDGLGSYVDGRKFYRMKRTLSYFFLPLTTFTFEYNLARNNRYSEIYLYFPEYFGYDTRVKKLNKGGNQIKDQQKLKGVVIFGQIGEHWSIKEYRKIVRMLKLIFIELKYDFSYKAHPEETLDFVQTDFDTQRPLSDYDLSNVILVVVPYSTVILDIAKSYPEIRIFLVIDRSAFKEMGRIADLVTYTHLLN